MKTLINDTQLESETTTGDDMSGRQLAFEFDSTQLPYKKDEYDNQM